MGNTAEALILWIAAFIFGWAIFLQLPTIFPSVVGNAFTALRGGFFALILLSLIGILGNISELVNE